MGQIETTHKELTLEEWVNRLPEGHGARQEYKQLLAAKRTLDTLKEAAVEATEK